MQSPSATRARPATILVGFDDVLMHMPEFPEAPIPQRQWKLLLNSPPWYSLETGNTALQDVLGELNMMFTLADGAIEETLRQTRARMVVDLELISSIQNLKRDFRNLRVFLSADMSQDCYDAFRDIIQGWGIFDKVFLSAHMGCRKSDRAFYSKIMESAECAAESIIFLDSRPENVIAAQCQGMHGVIFNRTDAALQKVHALLGDPILRGRTWLQDHAKNMWGITSTGVEVKEQFQQLFILHLTGDWSLVDIAQSNPPNGRWNMFAYGPPILTTDTYPDDLDTTTVALLTLDIPEHVKHKTMDDMLNYMNSDGLLYCYFDSSRPRLDALVTANVLRLFYANGRGDQLLASRRYLEAMLRTRAYEHPARYYHLPDFLLYYISDLCAQNRDAKELDTLRAMLYDCLEERMASTADPPSAAFRLIAANNLHMDNKRDRNILLLSQQVDGKWTGWIYRYGTSGILYGSDGLTTALALTALNGYQQVAER